MFPILFGVMMTLMIVTAGVGIVTEYQHDNVVVRITDVIFKRIKRRK
jgi:hypothetical protein